MGKFEIFNNVDGKLIKIAEQENRVVYDGREAWLDMMFGIESWFSGAIGYDGSLPASGAWTPYRTVAIGTVADDGSAWLGENSFLSAGSGITADSVVTGANIAHFPNLNDHWMSSAMSGTFGTHHNTGIALFYKRADKVIRTGRSITIEATFTTHATDGDKTVIPEDTEIREFGIFLGDEPTGAFTPSTVRAERPYTMLCRSVRYAVSGGYIQDNPITVGSNPITVRYTFGDQ